MNKGRLQTKLYWLMLLLTIGIGYYFFNTIEDLEKIMPYQKRQSLYNYLTGNTDFHHQREWILNSSLMLTLLFILLLVKSYLPSRFKTTQILMSLVVCVVFISFGFCLAELLKNYQTYHITAYAYVISPVLAIIWFLQSFAKTPSQPVYRFHPQQDELKQVSLKGYIITQLILIVGTIAVAYFYYPELELPLIITIATIIIALLIKFHFYQNHNRNFTAKEFKVLVVATVIISLLVGLFLLMQYMQKMAAVGSHMAILFYLQFQFFAALEILAYFIIKKVAIAMLIYIPYKKRTLN